MIKVEPKSNGPNPAVRQIYAHGYFTACWPSVFLWGLWNRALCESTGVDCSRQKAGGGFNMDRCFRLPFTAVDAGNRITIVLQKLENLVWVNPLTKQTFRVELMAAVGAFMTLHGFVVHSVSKAGVARLESDVLSLAIVHKEPMHDDFCRCIEVCAGMGGTSMGAYFAGCNPVAAVDFTQLATQALKRNLFPDVMQGDITEPEVWMQLHSQHPDRCGLLAGFPCQPFSQLGRGAGFDDPRSRTFFRVLDLAWALQSAFVLLECVSQVATHPQVKKALDQFCHAMDYHWTSVHLQLANTWPCKRQRWWAIILPRAIKLPTLVDLPHEPSLQRVADVFPFWPQWPLQEERQLELTDREREFFSCDSYPHVPCTLEMSGKCPTLLHSMGFQLYNCPCGCRAALSEFSLASKGLHGVMVGSCWRPLSWWECLVTFCLGR